jgi:hypothetical protein
MWEDQVEETLQWAKETSVVKLSVGAKSCRFHKDKGIFYGAIICQLHEESPVPVSEAFC